MIRKILDDKPTRLFIFFTAFFVANALIAECIGSKLFSLESTLGFKPFSFSLFGQSAAFLYADLRGFIMAAGICNDGYYQ